MQLLAILRNLSDGGNSRDKLLTTDSLLDHLCSVLMYHCCDPDVAFNLCRLLRFVHISTSVTCYMYAAYYVCVCHYSKLTQHNDHRSVVMQHLISALPAFVGLLTEHMTNPVMYYNTKS